jgi:hypothetical protein
MLTLLGRVLVLPPGYFGKVPGWEGVVEGFFGDVVGEWEAAVAGRGTQVGGRGGGVVVYNFPGVCAGIDLDRYVLFVVLLILGFVPEWMTPVLTDKQRDHCQDGEEA